MKIKIIPYLFILFSIVCCKDKDPILRDFPVIKTLSISNIDSSSVVLNGQVLKKGNSSNCVYGFLIDTIPTVYGKSKQYFLKTSESSSTYSLKVDSNLINGFKYYVTFFSRINNNKIVYANTISFVRNGCTKCIWDLFVNTNDWIYSENNHPETKIACISTKSYGLIVSYKYYKTFYEYIFNPKTKTFSKNKSDIGNSLGFFLDMPDNVTTAIINDSINVIDYIQSRNLRYENKKWIYKTDFLFLVKTDHYSICQNSNDMYCFGDYQTLIYNLTTKQLTTNYNTNYFPGTTLCTINNEIYGIYDDYLRKYSKEQNKWIPLSKTPGTIAYQSTIYSFDNKIFSLFNSNPDINGVSEKQLWYFDINSQKWTLIKFPGPISFINFNFLIDDKFYLGYFATDKYVVWELDLSKI